jgi:pimeloyl-ACP methyl ester carboxylesterase
VHGLATNLAFWYGPYADRFSRRFRLTLIDLRGHGRSEVAPGGYCAESLARDLAGLLDGLGIDSAHFVTHSFGSVVALRMACETPRRIRSLVVADAHIACVRNDTAAQAWAYGRKYQPLLDRHGIALDTGDPYFGYKLLTEMARLRARGDAFPAELTDLIGPLMGSTAPRTAARWLELMDNTLAASEIMGDDGLTRERLRALQFPILALYGESSHARPTGEHLLELWPHAEFRWIPDAGHFFPASRPAEVIAHCERFWEGVAAASQVGVGEATG